MASLNFDSTKDYQRIFASDSFAVSVANPNSQVVTNIPHTLGYVPVCKVWFTNAAGEICAASGDTVGGLFTNFTRYNCYFWITNGQLTITFDRGVTSGTTINSTIYYRIYTNAVA